MTSSSSSVSHQYGRRSYRNNNSIAPYDDDYDENGAFLKSVLFQDPKVLAESVARRLEQNGRSEDPLVRYYEIREHLNVFLWTLQDIMERPLLLNSVSLLSSISSSSSPPPPPLNNDPQPKYERTKISTTRGESFALSSSSLSSSVMAEDKSPDNNDMDLDKDDDNENENNNSLLSLPSLPFPPLEAIRRISESGFLTSNELGRFLFMTSPRISHQLGNDFCWTCICRMKFPKLLTWLSSSSPSSSSRSHSDKNCYQGGSTSPEWIVRQFSQSTVRQTNSNNTDDNNYLQPSGQASDQRYLSTTTAAASSSSSSSSSLLQQLHPSPPKWPPIDQPSIAANDLQFIVSWYSNNTSRISDGGPPTATLRLSGRRMNEFLQRGQVTIPIPSDTILHVPMEIDETYVTIHVVHHHHQDCRCRREYDTTTTTKDCNVDDNNNNNKQSQEKEQNNHHTIPPYRICCIHETDEHSWDPAPTNRLNLNHTADLYLGPGTPSLLQSSGKDLETRLAREDREPGGFEILVVAHMMTAADNHDDNDDDDDDGIGGGGEQRRRRQPQPKRVVQSLSLQFWANFSDRLFVYNSREQSQKHGVTLLHILDQLEGWR